MGPLKGIKVIEMAGIGPGPFAAMLLADMGAEVIRIDRSSSVRAGDKSGVSPDTMGRGRRSIGVNLKHVDGVATILGMLEKADVLIEGFRPGVMERNGLGPETCLARNPRLVYGRMTGWGQEGPLAQAAGHDINYIAIAGALGAIGRRGERPLPPLNLVGDYGGGSMFLVVGILGALVERATSGKGQVVDAAMVDGAAYLMSMFYAMKNMGMWQEERGVNLLDTGAHFYEVYETRDGRHVALGAIEPQFYAEFLKRTGLDQEELPGQMDMSQWGSMTERLAKVFKTKTRDEWCALLEGTDACFAGILTLSEAPVHPHNQKRGTFIELGGAIQPGPAPRFSRTKSEVVRTPPFAGRDTDEVLAEWGVPAGEITRLREAGAIA